MLHAAPLALPGLDRGVLCLGAGRVSRAGV
jgi:hypothetical protein